jgi:hypothetical protein
MHSSIRKKARVSALKYQSYRGESVLDNKSIGQRRRFKYSENITLFEEETDLENKFVRFIKYY